MSVTKNVAFIGQPLGFFLPFKISLYNSWLMELTPVIIGDIGECLNRYLLSMNYLLLINYYN